MPQKWRAYGYRIITVAIPLLTAYGVIDETVAPQWVALGAAMLGTATASAYTSRSGNDTPD